MSMTLIPSREAGIVGYADVILVKPIISAHNLFLCTIKTVKGCELRLGDTGEYF
jgi:hypothetical protein